MTFHFDRVDAIPAIQSAGPIAFMKLDIEGHEAMAIAGAEATIRRDHPLIALEVLKEEICDGTAASIEALRNMGYQHFHIPVESGLTGRVSPRFRKPLRNLQTVFSGKRPSKAATLRRIDRLEQRNYLMVLCAHDPPQYAD